MKKLRDIFNKERLQYSSDAYTEWHGLNDTMKRYVMYLHSTKRTYSNPSNSSLLYALGITNQKPNGKIDRKGKGGLCDLDIDFPKDSRHKVIEYVTKKYGTNRVAHIGTFNMNRAKNSVRSIAKVLGHPYEIGDELSRLLLAPIAGKPQPISTSIAMVPELQKYLDKGGTRAQILQLATQVEGLISSSGVHASGVVIANEDMTSNIPLFRGKSGEITTQWEMNTIEDVGYIKYDFLGLDALSKIQKCLDLIDKPIDVRNLPHDDKVFENIRTGNVVGMFQLEASSGMQDLVVKVQPQNLEDLCAIVALYRPGPLCLSGDTKVLTGIKNGKNKRNYQTTTLEELYKVYEKKSTKDKIQYPRYLQSVDTDTLELKKNKIVDVYKSGVKSVYKLCIQTGLNKTQREYKPSSTTPQRKTDCIKATIDHKFYTLDGWKRLGDIKPGEYIAITHSRTFGTKRKENTKVYGCKNFQNITFRHYKYECIFCDWQEASLDVHHICGNKLTDNNPSNLCFVCPNHHRILTEQGIDLRTIDKAKQKKHLPFTDQIMFVKFIGLEPAGQVETYDIQMSAPYNNFIAGDFVVHNSSGYADTYVEVKAGRQKATYLVPEMKPILENTYSIILYQEQIMHMARELCGYTRGEADELRKAVGKKKLELLQKHEPKFKDGWEANGYDRELANGLWEDLLNFADYCFNKSHALAYAYITYITAYLKTHYPEEFMCAVMICEGGSRDDIIKCITECKRLGIKVLPPDINKSGNSFSVSGDNEIRFGLGPIKNLGEKPVESIVRERRGGKFTSLLNFCERIDSGAINRLKVESLIRAGAFDSLHESRRAMLSTIEKVWSWRDEKKRYESKLDTFYKKFEAYEQRLKDIEEGKLSETGKKLKALKKPEPPELPVSVNMSEVDEMSEQELQKNEHELLGFFVSSHPLENIRHVYNGVNIHSIDMIKQFDTSMRVGLAVVITTTTEITTKKKKQKMGFLHLEDLSGGIEGVLFPNTYTKCKDKIVEGEPLLIEGKIDITQTDDGKVTKLIIDSITPIKRNVKSINELLEANVSIEKIDKLLQLLERYKGNTHPVRISLKTQDGTKFKIPNTHSIGDYKGIFLHKVGLLG